jgi:hypothetical protein
MAAIREAYDLTCVVHVHSTYSDGTGTVPEIARAAQRAGVDVVLLTDHDALEAKRRGEERWYDGVLVLVAEEVSPIDRDHFLAFGIDKEINRRLSGPEVCEAVAAAGGFGFGAHPFSRGSQRFGRPGIKFGDLDCLDGIELWSFLNDTGERVRSLRDAARMSGHRNARSAARRRTTSVSGTISAKRGASWPSAASTLTSSGGGSAAACRCA